jgi:hypothetical protein
MRGNEDKSNVSKRSYSLEMRNFAVSLYYYSPKSYDFVRETFKNSLPSERTIRNWHSNSDCSPGFLEQSFEFINHKFDGKITRAALIFGE